MALSRWRISQSSASDQEGLRPETLSLARATKGFLAETEGLKLFELAQMASDMAPCLEIGSYCGKSALFIAEGCRARGRYGLFSIDHHRGSEEQQPGQEYFDAALVDRSSDPDSPQIDTFPHFRRNLELAGLLGWVIPILGESSQVAKNWPSCALSLVFIDGGHREVDADSDYTGWARHIVPRGFLCFHDIYLNAADGGQAPRRVFERARRETDWRFVGIFESLGVLQRR